MSRSVVFLYFAAVREATGKSEERVELPDDVRTAADLPRFLAERYPALAPRLDTARYAINEAFAENADELRAGDVVAVIPPVSGG